jgi:hypothetical protein
MQSFQGRGFWGHSSQKAPFTEEAFRATIVDKMGCLPGAYRYLSAFRKDFRENAFVADSGVLKAGQEIEQRVACWMRHPGVCEKDHARIYDSVLKVAGVIHSLLAPLTFYQFVAREESAEEEVSVVVFAAIVRSAGDAVALCVDVAEDRPGEFTLDLDPEHQEQIAHDFGNVLHWGGGMWGHVVAMALVWLGVRAKLSIAKVRCS